jgi:hypothetical protein
MLGQLGMTVHDAIKQYDIMGDNVFGKPQLLSSASPFVNLIMPKYSSKRMEGSLCKVIQNGLGNFQDKRQEGRPKSVAKLLPFQRHAGGCKMQEYH